MQQQIDFYLQKLAYEIDAADLFTALTTTDQYVVIDTRKASAYKAEHIPNAIHVPHATMNQMTTQELDPSKTYVVYCDGIGCNGSTKGALLMTKLGFTVRELIGGLQWWKQDGYATAGDTAATGTPLDCNC